MDVEQESCVICDTGPATGWQYAATRNCRKLSLVTVMRDFSYCESALSEKILFFEFSKCTTFSRIRACAFAGEYGTLAFHQVPEMTVLMKDNLYSVGSLGDKKG